MSIFSRFTDYYDGSFPRDVLIQYNRIFEAHPIDSDRELPLEHRDFLGTTVSDFVVYFCGAYYPGKRIVNKELTLNKCVYTFPELVKTLGFVDIEDLLPLEHDFDTGACEFGHAIKVVQMCDIHGNKLPQQEEVMDSPLDSYQFYRVMNAKTAALTLSTWLLHNRLN